MQNRPELPALRSNSQPENDGQSSSGDSLISQSSAPLQSNPQTQSISELLMASNIYRPPPAGMQPLPGPNPYMAQGLPPGMPMPEIETVPQFLERLKLQIYCDRFLAEGFDSMLSVFEMTEEDFTAMDVKRGHRRILQLEFARLRGFYHPDPGVPSAFDHDSPGYSTNLPIHLIRSSPDDETSSAMSASMTGQRFPLSASSGPSSRPVRASNQPAPPPEPTGKRRYRRHPKPDPAAPDKPPSAYVAFSAAVREDNKGRTFTELAKIVGDRWKNLDEATRSSYEETANAAKEEWTAKMTEYKRTDSYKKYQEYLLDFRERHPKQPAGGEKQPPAADSGDRQTPTNERSSYDMGAMSPAYMEGADKRDRSNSPGPAGAHTKRMRTASFSGGAPLPDEFAGQLGGTARWNERAFQPQAGPSGQLPDFMPARFAGEPLGLSSRSGTAQPGIVAPFDRYRAANAVDHQTASVSTSYDRSTLAEEE